MVSWRRGIEPVIAAVILIAVAIVVAVAVVGWILGLWGGLAGGSPQISVVNPVLCADMNKTSFEAAVYIKNTGAGSDKILSIYLDYGGSTYRGDVVSTVQKVNKIVGNATITLGAGNTVPANSAGWLYITFSSSTQITINPGDSAVIRIMFEKSGTQSIPVTAQSC